MGLILSEVVWFRGLSLQIKQADFLSVWLVSWFDYCRYEVDFLGWWLQVMGVIVMYGLAITLSHI